MRTIKTDLAVEAHEYYVGDGENAPDGVDVQKENYDDTVVTTVRITNESGAQRLQKKIGCYITIDSKPFKHTTDEENEDIQDILGKKLKQMLSEKGIKKDENVLVVGLGNHDITPDALGPKTISKLDITRHLFEYMPEILQAGTRPVSAIAPGVLGNTGIETGEVIKGITEKTAPKAIIAIDALAARDTQRLGKTIQIADTGINPGSGVGNKRQGLTFETLNVPVIAIGIPTVVDAATIADDAMEATIETIKSVEDNHFTEFLDSLNRNDRYALFQHAMSEKTSNMMVTPKEVDSMIEDASRVIAGGINRGLHD